MKTRVISFLLTSTVATCSVWAQSDMSTGEVKNRMQVSNEVMQAPMRRLALRLAPPVNWSYPTTMPSIPFAGGNGSQSSPYQIATAQQLANMAYLVNTHSNYRTLYYELIADIVLNQDLLNEDRSLAAAGAQWTPIGNRSSPFSGHFNGNRHTVKGTYIYTTDEYTGLFGYVSGAIIEDLGTVDGYIYGCCRTGGIVGYAVNSTISSCYNTNTMYSKSSLLGGIVGNTSGSSNIVACYNAGYIYCYGQYCGNHYRNGNCVAGVAGAIDQGGSISYCYNTGSVYGGAYFASGVLNAHNSSGPNVASCHNVGQVSCYNSTSTGAVIASPGDYFFSISPKWSQTYALASTSPVHNYSSEKSETEFADGTVLNLLDSEGIYFKQGQHYPVLDYVDDAPQVEEIITAEGACGDNAWWRLTDQGELIITGTGPMYDYGEKAVEYIQTGGPAKILQGIQMLGIDKSVNMIKKAIEQDPSGMGLAPWVNYSKDITKITVEKGITSIAQGAFLLLSNVTEASIPSTIEQLGAGAFGFCMNLTDLYSYAVIPPTLVGALKEYTFCYTGNTHPTNYNNPSKCTLHVSVISKDKYAAADGWQLFTKVTNELDADWDPVLELSDEYPTIIPETYKAGNITYTRSGEQLAEGSYATFCLPFNIDLAAAKGVTAAYTPLSFVFYNKADALLNVFFHEEKGSIAAGTPFLAKLTGEDVVFCNSTETTLTEYQDPAIVPLTVYDFTDTGGIMKPNSAISLFWNGAYTDVEKEEMYLYRADGTADIQSVCPAFRSYLHVSALGDYALNGIRPITEMPDGAQSPQDETPQVELGDMDGDGEISIIDITMLINKFLHTETLQGE